LKIIKTVLPSSHDFILFGDTHGGSHMSYESGMNSLVAGIADCGGAYCGHMGDMIEAISIDDKRFDLTAKVPIPLQQAQNAIKRYKPIANKMKFQLLGNHELKLWKFGNLSEYIAGELGVEYGTYAAIVEVSDEYGLLYRMYVSHGFGVLSSNAKDPEQRKANKAASLKQRLKNKAGDCLIMAMGHTHQLIVVPPTKELIMEHSTGKPKQKYVRQGNPTDAFIEPNRRWYVNTGSFYKLYTDDIQISGYGEIKGYDPTELGYGVVEVRDRKVVNVREATV
jgi:hypothetical protein